MLLYCSVSYFIILELPAVYDYDPSLPYSNVYYNDH